MEMYPAYPTRVQVAMRNNPLKYFVIVLTFFVLLAALVFMFLATNVVDTDIFIKEGFRGAQRSAISPALWVSVMFAVIVFYQFIWVCYGLSTLCNPGINNSYLYTTPYLRTLMYFLFILVLILEVALLFVIDWEIVEAALAFELMMVILLYVCLYFSISGLCQHGLALYQAGLGRHVRLVRGLVQNGLALYAAHMTMTTINITIAVLQKHAGASEHVGGIVGMSIIGWILLSWVMIDWCILEKHLRYVFSPYFAYVFYLTGILMRIGKFDPCDMLTIFSTCLVGFSVFALVVKIALSCTRVSSLPDPILLGCDMQFVDHKVVQPTTYATPTMFQPANRYTTPSVKLAEGSRTLPSASERPYVVSAVIKPRPPVAYNGPASLSGSCEHLTYGSNYNTLPNSMESIPGFHPVYLPRV